MGQRPPLVCGMEHYEKTYFRSMKPRLRLTNRPRRTLRTGPTRNARFVRRWIATESLTSDQDLLLATVDARNGSVWAE